MFKLVIEDDEGNKTVVPVIRDEITIGRQEGNTIRLTERNVSRRHARLVREDEKVFLEEISARYGTRKNGERIDARTDFGIGDVFSIGDYRLTLQSEAAEAPAPPEKINGVPKSPPAAAAAAGSAPPRPANPFADSPTQVTQREEIGGGTEILPAAPAKLVIVSSNFAGQEFPLKKKEMVIGRGDECDIIVDHRSVSTQHAKIVREQGGEYKIVDLNSKNGVKVSGEEYRNVHLKRGDVVELGHVRFRFVEPGENYVFTPQAVDDFAPVAGSSNAMLYVGIFAAIMAISAVLAFVFMGEDEPPVPEGETPTVVAEKADEDIGEAVAPEPDEKPETQNKAAEAIAKAQEAFEEGRMPRAIETLNTVRDYLEPTPEQVEQIENLLTRARMEKTPARDLEVGRDHLNNERWVDALKAFSKIPPDTAPTVYAILERDQLVDKAIEGILADARQAAGGDETDKAEELANQVLIYEKENPEALAVLASLEKKEVARAKPRRNKRPPRDRFTADPEEGKALFKEASRAMVKGDWETAVGKCKLGLKHGETRCHRVLGLSYKNTGRTDKACYHLKRIGAAEQAGMTCD